MFLKVCIKPEDKLSEHEYYIQMVTDNLNMYTSPHVKFIDPYTNTGLVGVEKPSSKNENGWYISKNFYKRNSRGIVCLVEVRFKIINIFAPMIKSIIHPITCQSFSISNDTPLSVITDIILFVIQTIRLLIGWLKRPLLLHSMYG